MKYIKLLSLILLAFVLVECHNISETTKEEEITSFDTGTFGYDLNFLKERDNVIVLKNESGEGQVIVSAKYQGKVFTSTADGLAGTSFGWVNYSAFDEEMNQHMNAYGGENRLWLGPEGGQYSIFFKPGSEMEFENWKTPPAIDTESWEVISSDEHQVSLKKETSLINYKGHELMIGIRRDVRILENADIEDELEISLDPDQIQAVGYKTDNSLTNKGDKAWTKITGAPCLWVLDMFTPSPATTIVIPFNTNANSKIANTDYFGEIPEDRINYGDSVLLFKADGRSRGKIGITPERAKPVAGSYDEENKILTITTFDVDNKGIYLNQEWTINKDPLQGDAVNAYNDGPLEDGTQLGPFYELESVSPAAFLQPGQTLSHQHNVFHFMGMKEALEAISLKILGISLENIILKNDSLGNSIGSNREIIFNEFDGNSPNGDWRKQYSHEYFPGCEWDRWTFKPTLTHGKMQVDGGYKDCPEEGNNQHVVRYDKTIDQTRAYTIECDFKIATPFISSVNSFCVNFNVQKGMKKDDKLNCWSINLDIHDLKTGKYTIKHMGFADIWDEKNNRYKSGHFAEMLPGHKGVGALAEPDSNHFKIEVNRRIDCSYSPNWVTLTWSDKTGIREHFEEDYSKFPFQPEASEPVRVGLNTHGTSWTIRNLQVYY